MTSKTETEPLYIRLLDEIEPEWRDSPTDEGNAGIAITAYALEHGHATIPELLPALSEFDYNTVSLARQNLLNGGLLIGRPTDCKVQASQEELDDGMWWVLAAGVAKGWMEVSSG